MPVTPETPGPYAPASAIVGLIERHRNRGLPSPIDNDVLARASISPSLIPRTLQALQTLDLIDKDKRPTPVLEGIRLAPESDYKTKLSEWLQGAYADALQFVDPAKDDESAIRDAFRKYSPTGQQDRMVTLFTGLFRAAGIGPEKVAGAPKRKVPAPVTQSRAHRAPLRRETTPPQPRQTFQHHSQSTLPAPLAGLLSSLPDPEIGWTKEERDRFVATFAAVLDFCFPPVAKHRRAPVPVEDDVAEEAF